MLNNCGVAGWAFMNNEKSVIIKDAYKDKRFNKEVDDTDIQQKSMICCPIYSLKGENWRGPNIK